MSYDPARPGIPALLRTLRATGTQGAPIIHPPRFSIGQEVIAGLYPHSVMVPSATVRVITTDFSTAATSSPPSPPPPPVPGPGLARGRSERDGFTRGLPPRTPTAPVANGLCAPCPPQPFSPGQLLHEAAQYVTHIADATAVVVPALAAAGLIDDIAVQFCNASDAVQQILGLFHATHPSDRTRDVFLRCVAVRPFSAWFAFAASHSASPHVHGQLLSVAADRLSRVTTQSGNLALNAASAIVRVSALALGLHAPSRPIPASVIAAELHAALTGLLHCAPSAGDLGISFLEEDVGLGFGKTLLDREALLRLFEAFSADAHHIHPFLSRVLGPLSPVFLSLFFDSRTSLYWACCIVRHALGCDLGCTLFPPSAWRDCDEPVIVPGLPTAICVCAIHALSLGTVLPSPMFTLAQRLLHWAAALAFSPALPPSDNCRELLVPLFHGLHFSPSFKSVISAVPPALADEFKRLLLSTGGGPYGHLFRELLRHYGSVAGRLTTSSKSVTDPAFSPPASPSSLANKSFPSFIDNYLYSTNIASTAPLASLFASIVNLDFAAAFDTALLILQPGAPPVFHPFSLEAVRFTATALVFGMARRLCPIGRARSCRARGLPVQGLLPAEILAVNGTRNLSSFWDVPLFRQMISLATAGVQSSRCQPLIDLVAQPLVGTVYHLYFNDFPDRHLSARDIQACYGWYQTYVESLTVDSIQGALLACVIINSVQNPMSNLPRYLQGHLAACYFSTYALASQYLLDPDAANLTRVGGCIKLMFGFDPVVRFLVFPAVSPAGIPAIRHMILFSLLRSSELASMVIPSCQAVPPWHAASGVDWCAVFSDFRRAVDRTLALASALVALSRTPMPAITGPVFLLACQYAIDAMLPAFFAFDSSLTLAGEARVCLSDAACSPLSELIAAVLRLLLTLLLGSLTPVTSFDDTRIFPRFRDCSLAVITPEEAAIFQIPTSFPTAIAIRYGAAFVPHFDCVATLAGFDEKGLVAITPCWFASEAACLHRALRVLNSMYTFHAPEFSTFLLLARE
jgi:hypothetical protein